MKTKSKESTKFDIVSLGEVMLRLDPGDDRIRTARSFRAWEGGGEYNVARGLKKCFGLRAGLVSAFAKNEVGYLLEDFIMQGGVNMDFVKWVKADGAGRNVRNGLNFTERGYGIRGALGCSDRGHSAASQLKVGDIDWEELFGKQGVRWFHTGGIFAALCEIENDAYRNEIYSAYAAKLKEAAPCVIGGGEGIALRQNARKAAEKVSRLRKQINKINRRQNRRKRNRRCGRNFSELFGRPDVRAFVL